MVQLLPITEQTMIDRLNKAYGVQADLAYACIEKKEIKATILYKIEKDKGVILNISTIEADIFDGLVRIVFSSLRDLGIDRAEFHPKTDRTLLKSLDFVKENSFFTDSIEEILENHKNCKKN